MKNFSFVFLSTMLIATTSALAQFDSQNACKVDGYVCRAKSWSTKEARGVGRAKPTKMEAQESARITCRSYIKKTFPNFPIDYCEREIEFECVQTVLGN